MRAAERVAVVLMSVYAAGCTGHPVQLPPRTAPPPQGMAVPVPSSPVPEGHGRVVLSGTDGPMRVAAQADADFVPPGAGVPATRTGELCRSTPCIADLPVGRYTLYLSSADGSFSHGDTDVLVVEPGTTYYLRAPGRYEPPTWFPVLPSLVTVASVVLLSTGIVLAARDDASRPVGFAAMAGGIGLGIWGGIEYYDASRAKQQAGATTTWRK